MPRVYLTAAQKEEAKRKREITKLKRLISVCLYLEQTRSGLTQEEVAQKYGTSAPTLRKIQRCENVRIPYEGLLNMLLDCGLTITENETSE